MPTLTNGFVLGSLFLLASGYLIYDAPICRWWWSKSAGYVLYFRIIVTGLSLVFVLTLLLYALPLHRITSLDIELGPEHAPILAFVISIILRFLFAIGVPLYGKHQPLWKHKLDLKILNENGLDQIIYEKIYANEMIMVTLENNKFMPVGPLKSPTMKIVIGCISSRNGVVIET